MSMSVTCLSVCVCSRAYSRNYRRSCEIFAKLWCMLGLPMAVVPSFLAAMWYVRYFRFYAWRHGCTWIWHRSVYKLTQQKQHRTEGRDFDNLAYLLINYLIIYNCIVCWNRYSLRNINQEGFCCLMHFVSLAERQRNCRTQRRSCFKLYLCQIFTDFNFFTDR